MSQITTGIRRVLSSPQVYRLLQNFLGGKPARETLCGRYFNIEQVRRVIDIGCGPADILEVIPERIHYSGFDASGEYIEFARNKYRQRDAQFHNHIVDSHNINQYGLFDLALATGVLHHLSDDDALELFKIAKRSLAVNGRLVTIDPCYVDKQSLISRKLVAGDRGQNVRIAIDYQHLAEQVFDRVELHHHNNLLRVPYDHAVLICE
ncbi:MAG: class I SAM-dependent methyltransferase [Colwellia sp.]|jgi:Trans-aconitate methyltransferase